MCRTPVGSWGRSRFEELVQRNGNVDGFIGTSHSETRPSRRELERHQPRNEKTADRPAEDGRQYLDDAFDLAPEGAEFVFPDEYRQRAHGPGTTFAKIIRRAGLEAWPRQWHSMRASCETDLARKFPLAVVAKWLGNTQAVAMRHYVDVTDADFEKAIEMGDAQAARKAAQYLPEVEGNEGKTDDPENAKASEIPRLSSRCKPLRDSQLEAAGIEPAS